VYTQRGQYKKAEQSFRSALNAVPSEDAQSPLAATINSNLADTYRINKKLGEAAKQYAQTVELNPKAGVDPSQQVNDLEKYSSVLAASKQTGQAAEVKKKAESLRADITKAELKSSVVVE
jgi:tetratricopeptide (TPR) repeat protein